MNSVSFTGHITSISEDCFNEQYKRRRVVLYISVIEAESVIDPVKDLEIILWSKSCKEVFHVGDIVEMNGFLRKHGDHYYVLTTRISLPIFRVD
jgi:hypothetical protein